MIKKYYADLSVGQTHYRRDGQGQPLVMLHASPLSSKLMTPIIDQLSPHADVIALDTPGYGQSDPLPPEALAAYDDLSAYVVWLKELLDVLGIEKTGLYGTATGAQIAIEFARKHPDRVAYLVVDNAAHFDHDVRRDILSEYFPSIEPKADGSHLMTAWNMSRGVFKWFPWYSQDDEHQISEMEPPVAMVHATAMAYLEAGADYAQAYARAFTNERAERLMPVKVPVRVIRWSGSVVKQYADKFDDFEWPDNIVMRHCDGDVANRYQEIIKAVNEFKTF